MKKISVVLCLLFAINTIKAQDTVASLSAKQIQTILSGSVAFAEANKLKIAIAIYDANAVLVGFIKMDSTTVATGKVAIWKGLSAATYHYSTEETGKWSVPNAPDIATVPGGVVIRSKSGKVLGAIGVSGSLAKDDVKCAIAGINAANLDY
jgi:glc operon protein GlcG